MTTASDAARDLVIRVWDAIGRSGLEGMRASFADDYVRHSATAAYTREEFWGHLEGVYQAFPDLDLRIEDVVADDGRIAYRWTSTGTHRATYLGVPATNRQVTASGITISALRGDVIAEEWSSWNKADVLHALGVIPIDHRAN